MTSVCPRTFQAGLNTATKSVFQGGHPIQESNFVPLKQEARVKKFCNNEFVVEMNII
jgi:hypothetical protein